MTKCRGKLLIALNAVYKKYNRRVFVNPDPLQFVYDYKTPANKEIAAIIASSLAYGNVKQILKAVDKVLSKLGKNPKKFILNASDGELRKLFKNFKYRFTKPTEISNMLIAIRKVVLKYGSLNKCFLNYFSAKDKTILKAYAGFVKEMIAAGGKMPSLLPCPNKGSAFKRFNLYLRWMVRKDDVDCGCWKKIPKSKLIVPLDTHMHKIAKRLHLTKRKSADLKTALEITKNFAKICPTDPVKFDFSLTRFGIRQELNLQQLENCFN